MFSSGDCFVSPVACWYLFVDFYFAKRWVFAVCYSRKVKFASDRGNEDGADIYDWVRIRTSLPSNHILRISLSVLPEKFSFILSLFSMSILICVIPTLLQIICCNLRVQTPLFHIYATHNIVLLSYWKVIFRKLVSHYWQLLMAVDMGQCIITVAGCDVEFFYMIYHNISMPIE